MSKSNPRLINPADRVEPQDAAWRAQRAIADAKIAAEVARIEAARRHLGDDEEELRSQKAARRYDRSRRGTLVPVRAEQFIQVLRRAAKV